MEPQQVRGLSHDLRRQHRPILERRHAPPQEQVAQVGLGPPQEPLRLQEHGHKRRLPRPHPPILEPKHEAQRAQVAQVLHERLPEPGHLLPQVLSQLRPHEQEVLRERERQRLRILGPKHGAPQVQVAQVSLGLAPQLRLILEREHARPLPQEHRPILGRKHGVRRVQAAQVSHDLPPEPDRLLPQVPLLRQHHEPQVLHVLLPGHALRPQRKPIRRQPREPQVALVQERAQAL